MNRGSNRGDGRQGKYRNLSRRSKTPPGSGAARERRKQVAKGNVKTEHSNYMQDRYDKELKIKGRLEEFFRRQGENKNTTTLGQAYLSFLRAQTLWAKGEYASSAMMYVLLLSIVTTYAPHMRDTMGMEHKDAPVMGDHKAMLEYHYPVAHPNHGKYKNDKEVQKTLKHFEKRARLESIVEADMKGRGKEKKCCGKMECPEPCNLLGGRKEESWIDYSNRKTRKRRRRGGRKTRKKKGGMDGDKSSPAELTFDFGVPSGAEEGDTGLAMLESLSSSAPTPPSLNRQFSLKMDDIWDEEMEAFAEEDLGELSSPGLTHDQKMENIFYAAAWNNRKEYEEKARKKAEYDKIAHTEYGDGIGRPHTPRIDLQGKKSWENAQDLYERFKGIPPPYSLKDDGSVAVRSGNESDRNTTGKKLVKNIIQSRSLRPLITPIQDKKGNELNKELEEKTSFKFVPRKSESKYVMKPLEKHEPVKSPMTIVPNVGIGGRRKRKTGRGKKKKTRRIVCRKRKLTRKKRRRRR